MKRLALFFACVACSIFAAGCGKGDTIIRVGRESTSGTYDYFREHVLGKDAAGKQRDFKPGTIEQSGSSEVVELVSTTPQAIGYSGMGYATDDVKMLNVSSKKGEPVVKPSIDNAKTGTYPLARKLYIYTVGETTGAAKHYLHWIQSPEGQEIVTRVGYVPIDPVPMPEIPPPEPAEVNVDGSNTMVNLAQAWAEQYTKKYPDVKVSVNGGGSGVGIAKLIDGTIDLANASREMKPDERSKVTQKHGKDVQELVVGLDALAIYVHKQNPLNSISIEELAEIFGDGGTITHWSQLGSASSASK
jgi:ABC-type phosphate transport system substrate-binding protein